MKTIFMFLIVCAFSAATAWADDPRQLDFGGVKLGAPGAGLKTHIENLENGYTCRDLVGKDAKVVGYDCAVVEVGRSPNNSANQLIVGFSERSGVWYIQKREEFEKGSRPTLEVTTEALRGKYGQASVDKAVPWPAEYHMDWIYDIGGALLVDFKDRKAQLINTTCVGNTSYNGPFYEICGVSLSVRINNDPKNNGMVSRYSAFLKDMQPPYQELLEENNRVKAEKDEALRKEKEKAVAPKF